MAEAALEHVAANSPLAPTYFAAFDAHLGPISLSRQNSAYLRTPGAVLHCLRS